MGWALIAPSHRYAVALLAAALAFGMSGEALARAKSSHAEPQESQKKPKKPQKPAQESQKQPSDHKKKSARSRAFVMPKVFTAASFGPRYAAIVIDDNSGSVLHELKADETRHPASLAKVMTLYLLFEQLEDGKLKLDTPLPVSPHASKQRPVKLGLKPGTTITVEEALKALVTKSANDAAAVIGEAIGGTEEDFAKLMTLKARSLGMLNTVYINASGLPADDQITTARDQAVLGRAIQHRFPVHFKYFSTPSFKFRNAEYRNHNMLLGNVDGVDGIKTGYTDASGYNLLSSVHRKDKNIVAVVLGGPSNGARDARMRQLIEECIPQAATVRTAPMIKEQPVEAIAPVEKPIETAAKPVTASPAAKAVVTEIRDDAPVAKAVTPEAAPALANSNAATPAVLNAE